MNDAELIALAAIVNAEAIEREATNKQREVEGKSMAYDESIAWPNLAALKHFLTKRGYIIE